MRPVLGDRYPTNGKFLLYEQEFYNDTSYGEPWSGWATGSGTIAMFSGANRPGVVKLVSSATAGSGYKYATESLGLCLSGGETTELIFNRNVNDATIRMTFGFNCGHDLADAVVIEVNNLTLKGRVSKADVDTFTASTYTLVASTWYKAKIEVNRDKSGARFILYDEAGVKVWEESVVAAVPITPTTVDQGVYATSSGTTTGVTLVLLDYMNLYYNKPIPPR
jgi:hypothetical protein